jgi:hypothetical protein
LWPKKLKLRSYLLITVAQVFRLPQLMLDAPEMARVLAKARAKLLDLYGDMEKVRTNAKGSLVT